MKVINMLNGKILLCVVLLLVLANPTVEASHNSTQHLESYGDIWVDFNYDSFHLNRDNMYRIDVSVTNDSSLPVNITLIPGSTGSHTYMYNFSSDFDNSDSYGYYEPYIVLDPGESTYFNVAYGCWSDDISETAVKLQPVSASADDQSTVVFNATDKGENVRDTDCPSFSIPFPSEPVPFSPIFVIIGTLILIRRYANSK